VNTTFRRSIALLLAFTLLLAACGSPATRESAPAPAAERAPIKIAMMGAITGDLAAIGEQQRNFARLAVEQFNARTGFNVELLEIDTQCAAEQAVPATERLLADLTVYGVVGPTCSQETGAAAPVAADAELALISPSATSPELTEQGNANLFRVVPRDDVQGVTDAEFILEQFAPATVLIIDDQTGYSRGLADAAEQVFVDAGVVVAREAISQDLNDFSALITRIRAEAPDAIFLPFQVAAQGALFARQMAEQGVAIPLVGGDGMLTEEFITQAAGASEGAYASFFAPDVTALPGAQEVVAAYEAEYGAVGPFGPPAYVATVVLLEAIERAYTSGELSRAAVRAEVAATNQPDSLLGIPIRFDEQGDIRDADFFVYQVQGGAFVPVK
jgi:branched-chain amino acid transport system substrate-binding protein